MQIMPIEFYTLKFLQTINDWQKWTEDPNCRKKLIEKMLLLDIPNDLKQPPKVCYRVTDFNKNDGRSITELGINEYVDIDRITSWTLDYDIAKNFFKAPLKPENGINFIVKIYPVSEDIVINLHTLYSDENFIKACRKYEISIQRYDKGINKYKDSQKEIILNPRRVYINEIFAFGGYSSEKKEIMRQFFHKSHISDVTSMEQKYFEQLERYSPIKCGAFWINHPQSISRYIDLIKVKSKQLTFMNSVYPFLFERTIGVTTYGTSFLLKYKNCLLIISAIQNTSEAQLNKEDFLKLFFGVIASSRQIVNIPLRNPIINFEGLSIFLVDINNFNKLSTSNCSISELSPIPFEESVDISNAEDAMFLGYPKEGIIYDKENHEVGALIFSKVRKLSYDTSSTMFYLDYNKEDSWNTLHGFEGSPVIYKGKFIGVVEQFDDQNQKIICKPYNIIKMIIEKINKICK